MIGWLKKHLGVTKLETSYSTMEKAVFTNGFPAQSRRMRCLEEEITALKIRINNLEINNND